MNVKVNGGKVRVAACASVWSGQRWWAAEGCGVRTRIANQRSQTRPKFSKSKLIASPSSHATLYPFNLFNKWNEWLTSTSLWIIILRCGQMFVPLTLDLWRQSNSLKMILNRFLNSFPGTLINRRLTGMPITWFINCAGLKSNDVFMVLVKLKETSFSLQQYHVNG